MDIQNVFEGILIAIFVSLVAWSAVIIRKNLRDRLLRSRIEKTCRDWKASAAPDGLYIEISNLLDVEIAVRGIAMYQNGICFHLLPTGIISPCTIRKKPKGIIDILREKPALGQEYKVELEKNRFVTLEPYKASSWLLPSPLTLEFEDPCDEVIIETEYLSYNQIRKLMTIECIDNLKVLNDTLEICKRLTSKGIFKESHASEEEKGDGLCGTVVAVYAHSKDEGRGGAGANVAGVDTDL